MSYKMEKEVPVQMLATECPSCSKEGMRLFYAFDQAPVHSVLLMPTREEALKFPRGSVTLGFCDGCGFISNTSYEPAMQGYSDRCEETQGYSETFNSFAKALAADLVERHSLRGKHVIEIGCGKGEFLAMVCEIGGNRGTGFDPAYVQGRLATKADLRFITDFYSDKYSDVKGDFIICKMTLEHIGQTGAFLSSIRKSLEDSPDTVLFFQVPDVTRILRELAFWDIYYEHCSYFSPGSLARLFRANAFEVTSIRRDYGGQYIILEARPTSGKPSRKLPEEDDLETIKGLVEYFTENVEQKISLWKTRLREFDRSGLKTVIWGSGSKGVAFLTTLGTGREVACAVDINPYREGTFMTGTGHRIVSPESLTEINPDAVILMNPVYTAEVERELKRIGISAEILTV